jgi:hypothetical protein
VHEIDEPSDVVTNFEVSLRFCDELAELRLQDEELHPRKIPLSEGGLQERLGNLRGQVIPLGANN